MDVVLCEHSVGSKNSTGGRRASGEANKNEGAAAAEHSRRHQRPLSPPPPPPLPDPNAPSAVAKPATTEVEASQQKTGEESSSSHNNNNDNNINDNSKGHQQQEQQQEEDESVAVLIPHNFAGLTSYSAISSLNSSFRSTYDACPLEELDDDAMDPDDILNLELVEDDDDDDDTCTHASTSIVEVRDPLHIPVALRELWLSPQQQQQQQIPSNRPHYPTSSRASGTPSYSTSLLNNAYHEREDKVPVWPSRGRSICSEDSESIKAALNKQCFSQHKMSPKASSNHGSNNNSNHSKNKKTANNTNRNNSADQLHNSNDSSFPSMWEDSWSTFATLDNNNQAEVILEEGVYLPPSSSSSGTAPTVHGVTPKRTNGNGGPNIANQNSSSMFQQMSRQQRNLLGGGAASAASSSKSKRSSMITNTAPPRRTNSRNSQYSSYSDNMSRSTMDASQIKRVSRNERISRLKRKSLQPPQQGSVGSLSPTQNFRKHHSGNHSASVESSYASSSATASKHSLSQNSQKPQRRPTKVLPRDEEADAEPDTFFQHSESQLSLTSSEEEDEEYIHESDMTPRLPGRRSSVTSTIMYEEEQAAVRRSTAQDEPLSQPLRRNSTWGSTATSTINLEAHPETVEEEDDEESDGDADSEEEEESVVRLVLSDDNRYHVPVATHHLMEDNNSSSDNLPVSSIHLQDLQDDSDQNISTSAMNNNREMQDGSKNNFPSSIHLPPTSDGSKSDRQNTTTIENGKNPAPPGRTRSIPRAVVARNQREWLMTASSATAEDLQHVRRPRGLPDFIPNKPKRQTTLTKEDLYGRLLGGANADPDKDNDNSESEAKEKSSVNSSSLSISSPSNTSGGHKRLAVSNRGHRRSLSGEAPHLPMRQVSRTSTVMSPALAALESLSFHDSKEFLMLSNKDQDILQESLSSHAGDFDFGGPSRSLQSADTSSHSKAFHATRHHGSRGDLTETSLSVELHPVPPHGELENSTVSAATTHRVSNIAPPGRVLPLRHNTRGSSLRSAAASLQLRGSASSPHSDDDDANLKSDEFISTAAETLSPSAEFEELKKLNECTVQSLNEQLENLQVSVTASSELGGVVVDSLATSLDVTGNQMAENDQLQVSDLSSSARRNKDLGAASEQDASLDALGCSNHSSASVWTSASKEFEYLKVMMDDDTATDLETQLKMLEQLEADQNNDSTQEFDLSRLLNADESS